MRLLEVLPSGAFCLKEFSDNATPGYATLSHTWGKDSEEVTFEDMVKGGGKGKAGYEKIKFCGEQAKRDGLQYIWVDNCCIDKGNKTELSQAIRSMFRWYRNATRCYVYLSDVSTRKRKSGGEDTQCAWEQAFRTSKWFTRGWTLQELLAPHSVEFFSREGQRLGDRSSLRQTTHEITYIPLSALDGNSLSEFSVNERFSWIQHRETKLEEDKAYSMLGVFGVSIIPIYGEGEANAFKRLRDEIDKFGDCMRALYLTDPRKDKVRIEESKGGLLIDSYHWIIEHQDFNEWRYRQQSHLWIKGDPGKGKTMLLCGIIDELNKLKARTYNLSYFFCQATDSRINNATAVLRGLLFLLITEQQSLISHIQQQHDRTGKNLFEDVNAWVAVSEMFRNVLEDPTLQSTCFIINALDECTEGLPKLLDFIAHKSSSSPRVKWLVSSRNWPDIKERLNQVENKVRLSLELNATSISAAVDIYIKHKVDRLAQEENYDQRTRAAVSDHLSSNANDTFLWVALVCQNLQHVKPWNVLAKLNNYPPELDALYSRMMEHIVSSDDADLCKRILALAAIVYRPVTLRELTSLVDIPEIVTHNLGWLAQIIGFCGSFLTIRGDIIYFVHQSAKDYLIAKRSTDIFPSGQQEAHYKVFSRSLNVISGTLRRDIYDIRAPGCLIKQIEIPSKDPLAASRYSCIYWADHLSNCKPYANHTADLQEEGIVDGFLKEKYLYWLEALSLCKSMPKGVVAMAKLEALLEARAGSRGLLTLVRDAYRFIMSQKQSIQISPLQAYASALILSPARSIIRGLFSHKEPK